MAPRHSTHSKAAAAAAAVLVACLCVFPAYAGTYEEIQPTTYAQLKPTAGQWGIAVSATKSADKTAFLPVTCDKPELSAPCNSPALSADAADKVRVQLTLKDKPLKTNGDLAPKRVLVRACYTKPSAVDRPWRKANDVIDLDKSCPFVIKSTEFNSTTDTYSFDWPVPKNMTKATWFTDVLVACQNGTGLTYCQHDNTVNKTYMATNIINSTPPGMVVATAVCSAIGPLFLGAYFIRDTFLARRGKASS